MSIEQKIARLALVKATAALNTPGAPDPYVDASDRTVLGETDHGTIMAPRQDSPDWWEAFDFRKPGHMAAWRKTRETGLLAFLDLESNDPGS